MAPLSARTAVGRPAVMIQRKGLTKGSAFRFCFRLFFLRASRTRFWRKAISLPTQASGLISSSATVGPEGPEGPRAS